MRARTVVGLLLALALALVSWRPAVAPSPSAEQLVLLRRTQTLSALVARSEQGPLLSSADVVVVVSEHLVQDLVSSVLPIDTTVGSVRVHVDRAVARFEDGLALVRFDARAVLAGSDSSAEMSLFAGIDRVQLDAASGQLRGRLTVFAVDAPRVRLGGHQPDLARLVRALGPAGIEALTAWLPAVPIPLLLRGELALPALGSDEFRVAASSLPLAFSVREVQVFRGRLWVSLGEADGRTAPVAEAQIRAAEVPAVAPEQRSLFALASRGCSRERRRSEAARQAGSELVRVHEQAELRLARLLDGDPVARQALSDESEVSVALRAGFVESLVQRTASLYLRDVRVDLAGKVVRRQGEVRRRLLGARRFGEWEAEVSLDGVRCTAHVETPRVLLRPGNTVSLELPVRVPTTPASAHVRLRWRSRGLGRLVCRDFDLERRVEGVVPGFTQRLTGGFVLSAGEGSLVAQPFFENRTLHVPARLAPGSWEDVRQALATQDKLFRCGLALDPDRVVARLREVVARGFEARLPLALFRPLRLPAHFSSSVELADRPVLLLLQGTGTLVTEHGVWGRARMHALRESARAVAAESH